jgi:hypothetical protein
MATLTGSLQDIKRQWFAAKGYSTGTLNDQMRSFYATRTGSTTLISLNDLMYKYFTAFGYTGTLQDVYRKAMAGTVTDVASLYDMERAFYSETTNDFASAPDAVSGLSVWLKSNTAVYSDAGVTPATVDTTTVRQWNDQSGNSFHALQATAGNRPQYRTNQINTYPSIRFAGGSANYMKSAAFGAALSIPITVIQVMRIITIEGTTWFDGNTVSELMMDATGTGTSVLRIQNAGGSCVTNASVATTNWTVLSGLFKTGTGGSKIRLNGTVQASTGNVAAGTMAAYTLGARGNGGTNCSCEFAEVLVYNRELTAGEMLAVERYLGLKYAITVA